MITPPLLPKLPPIPVLTVSLCTDLNVFFQLQLINKINNKPTISIFWTQIYLLGNNKFKCYVILFSHNPAIFVYSSSSTTLFGCNSNIYCNPNAIKSDPSKCFIIYFIFNFYGDVAFTFHVRMLTLNGLVYWQCLLRSFMLIFLSWWIMSIAVCFILSMNF